MAKILLFSVRDSASETFGRPVPAVATGQAVRSFTDECNSGAPDNMMAAHPEDFELWIVGEFDDQRGVLIPATDGSMLIVRGKDVKRSA